MKRQTPGQLDIFEVLDGPPACKCLGIRGFALERDPKSEYHMEWVHSDASCRRSKFPGRKQHV